MKTAPTPGPMFLWLGALLAILPTVGPASGQGTAVEDRSLFARGAPLPEYPHRAVRGERIGHGPRSYWLFEPAEPAPAGPSPVVVVLHGWLSINPGLYGAWIEHLARRGAVVVFPRYQADLGTPPADFLPNATAAIRDALDVLETAPGRVRPDRARFALIGHSAGGNLAAQLAALAADPAAGLPRAGAVVAVFPGEVLHQDEPSLARIPAETLLVVAAGDRDVVVGDDRARQIYAEATAVPPERKEYVLYRTDRRGPSAIVAEHSAPTAMLAAFDTGEGPFSAAQMSRAGVDLLDRFGFWRLADATLLAAFSGRDLDEVTDRGATFRDLGRWSDGRVIRPPISGDDLAAIPRVALPYGARLMPAPTEWPRPTPTEAATRDADVRPAGSPQP